MGVVGPGSCWDAFANGAVGEESFENLFSILDFPMDSLEGTELAGDWDISKSHCLGPIPSNILMEPLLNFGPPVFSSSVPAVSAGRALEQKPVSGSDVLQYSNHLESTFFQSLSPNSVLESSGSCSIQKRLPVKRRRARSKRVRAAVNPWLSATPFLASSRKKAVSRQPAAKEGKNVESSSCLQDKAQAAAKKCAHCEITKTPQWREGPTGPKTLCNACGVRYRSGRLFPEYRPAASPTFIPSLHSNSHKKVIEMRSQGKQIAASAPLPEFFLPMGSCLFDSL